MIISGEPIRSPVVDHPDVLIAFNRPSLEKFASSVKKGGLILYDSLAGHFQAPSGGGREGHISPGNRDSYRKGCSSGGQTAMFGALMQAGNLGLPREAYGNAFKVTFAKKSKLIPKNIEILEAGAQAVKVLELSARR